MTYTPEQKTKLKALYATVATPEELKALGQEESALDVQEKLDNALAAIQAISGEQSIQQSSLKKVTESVELQKKSLPRLSQNVTKAFGVLADALVKKLEEVRGSIQGGSFDAKDFGPTLQNIVKGLSQVDKSIRDKPVPVWRWPQYLFSGLRNKQFEPINPATDGLGIGDFDYGSVTYPDAVTEIYTIRLGGATGQTKAVITIVYTDSTKESMSSFEKTPITS